MATITLEREDKYGRPDDWTVEYDFQPYEPMTREHPGCEAEVTVCEVKNGDESVITDILNKDDIEYLEQEIMEILIEEQQDDRY